MAWSTALPRTYDEGYYEWAMIPYYKVDVKRELVQAGTTPTGITLKLKEDSIVNNTKLLAYTLKLMCNGETVTTAIGAKDAENGGYIQKVYEFDITVPTNWVGKTVAYDILGDTGTFTLDGYGQFELTISKDIHAPAKVERTASPKAGAKTGILNNKAAVYTGDELTVTFSVDAGYEGSATLNGADITTGHRLTVGGSIAVITAASPKATIHLFLGEWATYMFRVYEGSDWGLYQAVIYNGSEWERFY